MRKPDYTKAQSSKNDACWVKVPHLRVEIGALKFDAPVAVSHYGTKSLETAMLEKDRHGYVYALPGGGRINSNGVIL